MNTKMKALVVAMLGAAVISVPAHAVDHYDVLSAGYYDGASVAGTVGFDNIFEKVPLGLELELGYSWSSLGEAIPACQVFINQNQNNSKTISSGGTLDLGLNATYPLPNVMFGPVKFWVFAGPRWARWDARHEYINGNEDFDVTGKVWGLGGGLRGIMPLGKKFRALLQLGLDYYPRGSIYGHDATYNPDNNNINARNNGAGYTYTYADAEAATAVPHLRPRVMLGLMF
jgi:hypothetical protein